MKLSIQKRKNYVKWTGIAVRGESYAPVEITMSGNAIYIYIYQVAGRTSGAARPRAISTSRKRTMGETEVGAGTLGAFAI